MAQQQGQTATPYYIPSPQSLPPQAPTSPAGSGGSTTAQPSAVMRVLPDVWQQVRKTLKGQFLGQASVILLFSLVLAVTVSQSFSRAADDLNTIGNGSIPSVDAAQAMAQYMEDIDAKSADYLA